MLNGKNIVVYMSYNSRYFNLFVFFIKDICVRLISLNNDICMYKF